MEVIVKKTTSVGQSETLSGSNFRVKIKTWGDMEDEFGLLDDGLLNTIEPLPSHIYDIMPINRLIDVECIEEGIYEWQYNDSESVIISDDIIEKVIV